MVEAHPAKMNVLNANGIELAFDRFGDEAGEPLILISGLGTQMIRWTVPFCQGLAVLGYQVIRFDNRDAGRSTHFTQHRAPNLQELTATLMVGKKPEVPYSLYDMADDVVGLLDSLSIDRAHVVGRSMGGMIAQIVAAEHPERVLSLTSIMSSTGNPALPQAEPEVMAMMIRPAPDPFSDQEEFLLHSLAFARRIAGTGYVFDEEAHRSLVLEEVRRAHDAGGVGRQIAAMAVTGDLRSRLATVKAPTLVVHGADDPLILPACGRDTASSIPDAEFLLLDGMGHDLPPALYDRVAEAIDRTARHRSL